MAAEQQEPQRLPKSGNGAGGANAGGANAGGANESIATAAGQIREGIGSQAEVQKDQVADRASRIADAVRDAARGMPQQDAWVAGLIERGAGELASLAETVRRNDLRSLLNHAEEFARKQPALFAGAAAVLGFALTRAARAGVAAAAAQSDPIGREQQGRSDTFSDITSIDRSGRRDH